jgi:hypothetical protein
MNDKTGKWGIMAAIIIPALIVLVSCEIPQSVRVKASPTYHIPIPLGSGGISNSFIRPYTDVEGIRKTLRAGAEEGKTIGVYQYAAGEDESAAFMNHLGITMEGSDPVQAYLLSYPIFNVDLNLQEYINRVGPEGRNVPSIDISSGIAAELQEGSVKYGGELPYEYWIDPFGGNGPVVDLGDLKSLVSNICFNDGVSFKIKIPPGEADKAEQLEKAIRVRAPQLKFGYSSNVPASWLKGTLNDSKTELVFSSNRTDEINQNSPDDALLLKRDVPGNDRLPIDIRLVNIADVGGYETELNFDWYSMDVQPQDGQAGEFAGFNVGSYLEKLGDGVTFLKVPASLYMHIPNSLEDLTVDITNKKTGGAILASEAMPDPERSYIIVPEGEVLPLWFDDQPVKYDFGEVLNTKDGIRYKINPPENVTIYSAQVPQDGDTGIAAYLVVILPMAFHFSADKTESFSINDGNDPKKYLLVRFPGMDDFLADNDSAMAQIDDQLGQDTSISSLTLHLSDIKNEIISAFYLAIEKDPNKNGPDNWHLVEIADDKGGSFSIDNMISLAKFPRIKFLIPADPDRGDGILYIKSQTAEDTVAFDVKISVQADISLDSEQKF